MKVIFRRRTTIGRVTGDDGVLRTMTELPPAIADPKRKFQCNVPLGQCQQPFQFRHAEMSVTSVTLIASKFLRTVSPCGQKI